MLYFLLPIITKMSPLRYHVTLISQDSDMNLLLVVPVDSGITLCQHADEVRYFILLFEFKLIHNDVFRFISVFL